MKTLRLLTALIFFGFGQASIWAANHSLAYVLQAENLYANRAQAVRGLAGSGRDWLVLDPQFSENERWSRSDLATLRLARPGRKILAYISIGEAENYRPYWQADWTIGGTPSTTAPDWLLAENPDWPGNFKVKFWSPAWQQIILSAVDAAMAQGFDGVYLDIVDAFEFFEQSGTDFIDNRINPETGESYRRDMVAWVRQIARRVRMAKRGALVVPQNGEVLLTIPTFLNTVSGMGVEDLFTDTNRLQLRSETNYRRSFLQKLLARNKPVLDIEYPTLTSRKAFVRQQAHAAGFTWLITDRDLRTLGTSGH